MTAVNLLMLPDAVHLFTDAGHFRDDVDLAGLGGKVIPLPRWNAVAVFHGPSLGGPALAHLLERSGDDWEEALVSAVASIERSGALGGRPFSAILAGHDGQRPFGMAIEEGGKVHRLAAGSVIKAPTCDAIFDLADIAGSGLRMMEDQRQRHGVVAGWCDHTKITPKGIQGPRELKRWDDVILPAGGMLTSAKIGHLEVDTINIGYLSSFYGFMEETTASGGSDTITVPNPDELPVEIHWHTRCVWSSERDLDIDISVSVIRSRDGKNFMSYSDTIGSPASRLTGAFVFTGHALDIDAEAGESYVLTTVGTGNLASFFTTHKWFHCVQVDKGSGEDS